MPTLILIGTLDTKGVEYDYVRRQCQAAGCEVILIDAGVRGTPQVRPDITRETAARAAGLNLSALAEAGDRNAAIDGMARGAEKIVLELFAGGRVQGIFGMGGAGGSVLASQVMRALPVGVPKLLVSTLAAGDTRPYIGQTDLTLMYSVVDIAGINRLSERILSNAAAAIAGMARAYEAFVPSGQARPLIGATMFGVTTPCVTEARRLLEGRGYEVIVFHATGTGGRSLENLIGSGYFAGVLDVTTTELADELVGGVLSAGASRLEAAGQAAIPQVVSLGALDMVNFNGRAMVPERFEGRSFHIHNSTVTLMRTTPDECAELGRIIAEKLNRARGSVSLFIPLRGVSMLAVAGGAFHDPVADEALIGALRTHLRPEIERIELDMDINDPLFAAAMVARLDEMIQAQAKDKTHDT